MTGPTIVEVPQWQGSGSPTARRLRAGSAALSRMFPAGERVRADVDDGSGTTSGGVAARDVLLRNLSAARTARAVARSGPVVTVGGDCGVELAPVEAALAVHGDGLAVVWFDAHADLNTPSSSPSGAFHGMVLRTLLGDGPPELMPRVRLRPEQVVLAGVRALDPGERRYVRDNPIVHLGVDQLAHPAGLVRAVDATGARAVYVHIDLYVLDPRVFSSVGAPEPGGLGTDQLVTAVHALAERCPPAGLGVTEYEPGHPGDQELLAAMITALAPVLDHHRPIDATAG